MKAFLAEVSAPMPAPLGHRFLSDNPRTRFTLATTADASFTTYAVMGARTV